MQTEFKFEIVRKIGVLSTFRVKGETHNKELNIVSWNGRTPKFDIREWNEDNTVMSRGITLTGDEICKLYELTKDYAEKKIAACHG